MLFLSKDERVEILRKILEMRHSIAKGYLERLSLSTIASRMDGFVARDLEKVTDRAIYEWLVASRANSGLDLYESLDNKPRNLPFYLI